MAPTPISVVQAAKSTPAKYTFAGGSEVLLESAYAEFDGSGSAASWLPSLAVYSPGGVLLGRGFPAAAVAAGDSAKVTFAPFPIAAAAAAGSTLQGAALGSNAARAVVTPWDYDGIVQDRGVVQTTSAAYFTDDPTYAGIAVKTAGNFDLYGNVVITGAGGVAGPIPTTLELAVVRWVTGGVPSAGGPFLAETHRTWLLPAGASTAPFTIPVEGFYMPFTLPLAGVSVNRSYGIWLHVTNGGADWQIASWEIGLIGTGI